MGAAAGECDGPAKVGNQGWLLCVRRFRNMPDRIWAKDPEEDIVYEAKICEPPKGYKAYPLTSYQVAYNLPIKLP